FEILAAKKKLEAFHKRIPQSYALEDPMLSFGLVNVPSNFSLVEEDMTMKEFSVYQKIPLPGARRLKKEVAEKEAEAISFEVEDKANEIIRNLKLAYYDLAHIYQATEIIQRNKKILGDFVKIAQTRYALGEGVQYDVLKAHVEISKMIDEQIMLTQKKTAFEAKLKSLLSRPQETALGKPQGIVFKKFSLNPAALQEIAVAHNPSLKKMEKMIRVKEKDYLLAQQEYYPDLGLRFSYAQRDDRANMARRDLLSAMVEVSIPIFYKTRQDPRVAEKLAEVQVAEAQYAAMKNEVFFMIADTLAMITRLESQVALYRSGIIPQASLQLNSAISAYKVDKVNFMTMIDSQMTLYLYELEYHQASAEYEKTVAQLENIIGRRFSPMERSR
ncbi:MAG: TolC family protein, partial [Desulfobacterales bacterium]|nr:TolC family protein [Desulfobacterales bacterium]